MKKIQLSLYNLILIIIIIFVILLIGILVTNNVRKKNELQKFISEMEQIQENVNLIRQEYVVWEKYNADEPGNFLFYIQSLGYVNANTAGNIYISKFNNIIQTLNKEETKYWNSNIDSILSNYFYFNAGDIKKYFGINDVDLNVIINFYTGNVIAKDGIKDINNKIIYRQYDSELGNKLVITQFNSNLITMAEVVENDGLSQKIRVSFNEEDAPQILEVGYFLDSDDVKKNCSDFQDYIYVKDENAVYFTVYTTGNYKFFIKDTNYLEYPSTELQIKLCNKPKLLSGMVGIYWDSNGNEISVEKETDPNWYNYSSNKLQFANAKSSDGNYWVWIPRFMYNVVDGKIDIEYTVEATEKSTLSKILSDYTLQKAFEQNDNVTGFWVSKFLGNGEYDDKVLFIPGKTLTVISVEEAIYNSKNGIIDELKQNSNLMSEEEKNAIFMIADANNIEIANDLVHYSGGGVDPKEYIKNIKYSSTGNIYGVYDLITSENEIFRTDNMQAMGRYRFVLK